MTTEQYVLKHWFCGKIPECVCGCGLQVKWFFAKRCYNRYAKKSCIWLGKKRSASNREKLRQLNIGEKNPNFGRRYSLPESFKRKLSLIKLDFWRINPDTNRGSRNGNWRGGLATSPYIGFTSSKKNQIRQRDHYTCQFCRHVGNAVHHIDYDKTNSEINNLICLCASCHSKTNFDRDNWILYFRGPK